MSKVYDFTPLDAKGREYPLSQHEGEVLLLVNTASRCGLTPQFEGLEALNKKYKEQGLTILGFPSGQFMNQELKKDEDIQEFCKVNFGVTFKVLKKTKVNGKKAEPLYQYLTSEIAGDMGSRIEWNFAKFLVDREGNVVKRYHPKTQPIELEADIEALL